jgi:hypothetical protein
MALKRESPPVAAGGARESDCLGAVSSEIIARKRHPQALPPRGADLRSFLETARVRR